MTALTTAEFTLVVVAFAALAGAAWARFNRLQRRHRDLADIHGFVQLLGTSIRFDDVARRAVAGIARVLDADRVTLRLVDRDGGTTWTFGYPIGASEVPIVESVGFGPALPERWDEGFAVPVSVEGRILARLSVMSANSRGGKFTGQNVERALDLADQLAVSLRNGLLHADVEFAALHDELTGQANRASFERLLVSQMAEPNSGVLSVLMLDLNQFKDVNDTLGHHVGDEVLVEFARRVDDVIDPGDRLARFGGDEFAILLRRRDEHAVCLVAEKILAASYSPLELEVCDAVVTTSIGIAYVHGHDSDPAGVLRRADIAMYAAKNQRSGIEVYREEIDRRTPARLSLLGDLRSAIERDELEVHYQPKVELLTSTVVGAEALVRWSSPTKGDVSPEEFIGVAEESGLIRLLTSAVLRKAVRRASLWRSAGFDLDVSVNLSAFDLHDETLVPSLRETLEEFGVEASCLVVEITESALMVDTVRTLATIEQLDLLGVRLSLDDFGTGYSSLAHLRQLPVSELKIDRSFVSDLLVNVHDDVIVRSTIDLGHNLGLRVVAEGIENVQVADHLTALGCDVGQGFGISRPLAPELFDRWLETTTYRVRGQDRNRIEDPSAR